MFAILAIPSASRADDESNRAVAQALFDDGVRVLEDAKCDDETVTPDRRPRCRDALEKFRRAFTLYPAGLGALRNAAFCERGLGLVASAMRDFREVARRAPLDPNPSKQLWAKHATDEADKLDKRVPRVVISAAGAPPRTEVALDGVALPEAAFGMRLPIDPGEHLLSARAPGHLDVRRNFEIDEREDLKLAVDLRPIPPPAPAAPRRRSIVAPSLVLGLGVVGVGTGLFLGAMARDVRDGSCDTGAAPIRCHDRDDLARARSYATASTIVTIAGASVTVIGAGWLLFGGRGQTHVGLGVAPVASGTIGVAFGAF